MPGPAGPTTGSTERVAFTDAAADLVRRLSAEHGPVMFHQSGGCCDGSSPMCYPRGEFLVGGGDVRVGQVAFAGLDRPVDVWMSKPQFQYWKHTHLTIDVVPGRGGGFSLESPEGVRFLLRSRLFTDDEEASLVPVLGGDEVEDLD
ncbi:DUF779 domain-containing protein [Aquihabitans sp. G128]|uniref:DUF779 domain-containing protein n=1 Tax=Aquihabitans sp. G128 TaxID=2849779 RepID=UPI001C2234C5|nr:DUF779 domain-containing protein [Aquihabitans sp. G128]QXC61244.1 DUF779 domain-containing protein [Aquihabitans sp. G128]